MKITKYFSYNRLNSQALENGKTYSFGKYVASYFVMGCLTIFTGLFYGLNPVWTVMVALAGMLFIPAISAACISQQEKRRKFNDVDIYLHQMIYSFQRQQKILVALEDTRKITNGNMQKCIDLAIEKLSYGTTEDLYKKALGIIEEKYPCARIVTLHRFLIKVEEQGGRYENSLSILLLDADNWTKRVYCFQEEIQKVKRTTAIGIIISFVMASVSVLVTFILKNTSDIKIDITKEPMYQIVSAVFLIFCIAYYTFVQTQYNCDWLVKQRSDKCILKDYKLVFHTDYNKIGKRIFTFLITGILVACIFLYMRQIVFAVSLLIFLAYLALVPQNNKRAAFERLKKDLYYDYADWLRDVALNLSNSPLQAAIEDTYDNCPVIMKESLETFIFAIEENPSDVTPYYEFLNQFQVLDISSSVRILYSVSESSGECMDNTVQMLIRRNYELLDRYEDGDNEDRISVMKFSEYIPTLFVSLKVAADMVLVITNYL